MATKSPTASNKWREMIGEDQFSQRREVFDKYDTVFLPPASPTTLAPASMDIEPIITSNHGKTTSNFRRTPFYSSMRENRREDIRTETGFRERKYSDNYTSELNQGDDVDYRHSMTERTRRLSKLRRDFLASNLHDPVSPDPFTRSGTRASLPVRNGSINYKIESPNLYKFPFAEPFATPPPVRRVVVDLGPVENGVENNVEKENEEPVIREKRQSLSTTETKVDHQKRLDDLIKRYSPERKPIDWKLPPTKPRVVGSVSKSTSDSLDSTDGKNIQNEVEKAVATNEVFIEENIDDSSTNKKSNELVQLTDTFLKNIIKDQENEENERLRNEKVSTRDSKVSLTELVEKNDKVPELPLQLQISREPAKRPSVESKPDLTIPDLLEKMNHDSEDIEKRQTEKKKVKRKRSFLDKVLGRKKEK